MVEWGGLENRCARKRTEGSNPSLSASYLISRQFVVQTLPIGRPDRSGRGRALGEGFESLQLHQFFGAAGPFF